MIMHICVSALCRLDRPFSLSKC